ncbi:hypothetical protein [Halomonas sp. BC04]|uniref:hypothetical protein n=1 Tax=Halomonas sp. BC04 TaxID=1403540 RepID=UPI0003ED627A|nr:hypothetical protein [Halomonas sp. BC04]EWG99632.1 hypothetical protein Q427_23720 [Halomonas sp. BC04]
MKRRNLTPDEREEKLVEATRRLLAGEISEGDVLRILRRDVLGLNQNDYAELVASADARYPIWKATRATFLSR